MNDMADQDWASFEKEVAGSIRSNSKVFLRRAAEEMTRHDDGNDAAFDHETGTVVTVFTQMALELAIAAFLVDIAGIRAILVDADDMTREQIRQAWFDNKLRTKKFEKNKQLLANKWPGMWRAFEDIVDMFQQSRNKIVHMHFHFTEGDLYDLKFEATYVLVKVVSYLLYGGEYDHADNVAAIVKKDTFDKLVRFAPYQSHVRRMAQDYTSLVLACPWCRQRAFAGQELKCFSCGYEHPYMLLLDCPACSQASVIYDKLNLDANPSMPSSCLHCGDHREVCRCTWCREVFVRKEGPPYCSQACRDDEQEKTAAAASGPA